MSKKQLYLHPFTERLWHWTHALLVVLLAWTGIHLHWPDVAPIFFGSFHAAQITHEVCGVLLVFDFFLWLGYNLISGRIKHYIPSMFDLTKGILIQAKFYGFDIFFGKPHPIEPTEDNKFNPLQKITYLGLMTTIVPLLLLSGLTFLFPEFFAPLVKAVGGIQIVAVIHTAIAFFVISFVIVHLYLTTTGETIFEEIKSMITGYKTIEH